MAHPSAADAGPSVDVGRPAHAHSESTASSSALPYLVQPSPPTSPTCPQPWPSASGSSTDSTLSPLPRLSALPARTSSVTPPHPSLSGPPSFTTSNSSIPTNPHNSIAYPPSTSDRSQELDPTAALIQKLYKRLDEQGVAGDGWDEGLERSRDGIINREELADGVRSLDLNGRNGDGAGSKEDYILKRVDRYGFFSQSHPAALACQHNRLATLAQDAFLTLPVKGAKPARSKTPSPTPAPSAKHLSHRASSASLLTDLNPTDVALESKRVGKWGDMLRVTKKDVGGNSIEWELDTPWWGGRTANAGGKGKYRQLQRRVFKGIPDRWRRAVWGLMMERRAKETSGAVPSLEALQKEYDELLALPSAQDVQIDLDVPRTISGHVLFHTRYGQGQRALFHVLHALGLHCEDIGGYCQGMGPIAATLLCYFEPERAYAGLVRLFDQYQLGHIFAPGFPGLLEAFWVQERLVEWLMPDVHLAFKQNGISTSAYATKWYITLFANSVPFGTQLRFWDGLLLEGVDFLVIASVGIIWSFRADFGSPHASFESILSALSSYFFVESDDAVLRWIRKTLRREDVRKKMRAWREEWKGFVREGTADKRVT